MVTEPDKSKAENLDIEYDFPVPARSNNLDAVTVNIEIECALEGQHSPDQGKRDRSVQSSIIPDPCAQSFPLHIRIGVGPLAQPHSASVFIDFAALHHKTHIEHRRDIRQGTCIHGNDIGVLARFKCAEAVAHVDKVSGVDSGRLQNISF